jgi:hypothetical protein
MAMQNFWYTIRSRPCKPIKVLASSAEDINNILESIGIEVKDVFDSKPEQYDALRSKGMSKWLAERRGLGA